MHLNSLASLKRLGPGLLFAATAVGVSHLVQSTRAGAEFGLTLSVLIVLVCLLKYPAFRFGAEYTAKTGESVIDGYRRQGRWLLVLILLATGIEGVAVIPAVSLVAAGLAMNLVGVHANPVGVTIALIVLSTAVLLLGRYRLLENITRVFVLLFSALTMIAALAAATRLSLSSPLGAPLLLSEQNLFFAVSVAGWMPVGLSGSIFLSLWVIARSNLLKRPITEDEARFDFNVGYVASLILALCFLMMGTALLFSTGMRMPESSVAFTAELVGLFTRTIGPWAQLVVTVAALAVMLSTVLAVVDGFPRVYASLTLRLFPRRNWRQDRLYRLFLGLHIVTSMTILSTLLRSFATFIDFVTALGFMTAPVIAYLNHRIMFAGELPLDDRPAAWIRSWSIMGVIVLAAIFPLYLYFRLT